MSFLPNTDNRLALFLFGLTTGVALTSGATLLFRSGTKSSHKQSTEPAGRRRGNSRSLSVSDRTMARLERLFTVDTVALQNMVKLFMKDMERGLERDGSILKMIPSFVDRPADGNEMGEYLALDFGGSNFRVCHYVLQGKGLTRSRFKKFIIPDDLKTGTGTALCDFFADCVSEFFDSEDIPRKAQLKMGYTFSFPVRQSSLSAGVLHTWTKGFSTSGVVDVDVVDLLQKSFRKKGLDVEINCLVNDTVGTLLSYSYTDPNTAMGVILGTGNNAAYIEEVANIPKWNYPIPKTGRTIINIEWGAWGSDGTILPRTVYDQQIDRSSPNPGQQFFEKMISGYYLGELARLVMVDLISTGELFHGQPCPLLEVRNCFDTANMSRIERDHSDELTDTRIIFETLYSIPNTSVDDRRLVKYICQLLGRRAARLAAVGIAAVCTKTNRLDGCTVAIDGSVFEFYPYFADRMRDALRELVGLAVDDIELAQARDGSGQGAALCACLAEKIKNDAL